MKASRLKYWLRQYWHIAVRPPLQRQQTDWQILYCNSKTISKTMQCTFIIAGNAHLEYFTLTSPTFLPRELDGSSDAIDVPGGFPFGSQNFSSILVRWHLAVVEQNQLSKNVNVLLSIGILVTWNVLTFVSLEPGRLCGMKDLPCTISWTEAILLCD